MSKNNPSRQKYTLAAVIMSLLITSALVFIYFTQEPKSDPASESLIRRAATAYLNKDENELDDRDFAQITDFTFAMIDSNNSNGFIGSSVIYPAIEISNIELLEKFVNLQSLNLGIISYPKDKIPRWMKLLAKIGFLDLNKRFTIDLSPIERLSYLKNLTLGGPSIRTIEPLAGLVNLNQLMLLNTQVSDLKPLKHLTYLRSLYLMGNSFTSLEALKGLENLRHLSLRRCDNISEEQIEDLQNSLPNLKINKLR